MTTGMFLIAMGCVVLVIAIVYTVGAFILLKKLQENYTEITSQSQKEIKQHLQNWFDEQYVLLQKEAKRTEADIQDMLNQAQGFDSSDPFQQNTSDDETFH